jgi:hypothetical protein
MGEGPYDVSIGRQLYEAQFNLQAMGDHLVTLTCRIDSTRYATLRLQMGSSDNSVDREEDMTINIYQSGNIVGSYNDITAGKLVTAVIDLQDPNLPNPENIAIEMLCSNDTPNIVYYHCFLNFVEAQLYPVDNHVPVGGTNASENL